MSTKTGKDKKLSLLERWEIDDKLGPSAAVYRCHMCGNRGDGLNCKVYGIIPEKIAKGKETCTKHIPGKLDFSKITL